MSILVIFAVQNFSVALGEAIKLFEGSLLLNDLLSKNTYRLIGYARYLALQY